jgi:uncharacterized protein YndB with AHSA1/START domain
MITQLFSKKKGFTFERTYPASVETVWRAWTEPEMLRQWWGPEHTTVPECEVDLRIGGRIFIVMEAGEKMGKYQGTRWPMAGTFSVIDEQSRLAYEARSWTDGEQDTSTIDHSNNVSFTADDGGTVVNLTVSITNVGPGAKMAAFGMKWGYKAQLDKLDELLAR